MNHDDCRISIFCQKLSPDPFLLAEVALSDLGRVILKRIVLILHTMGAEVCLQHIALIQTGPPVIN
jgi:hypothetical protein